VPAPVPRRPGRRSSSGRPHDPLGRAPIPHGSMTAVGYGDTRPLGEIARAASRPAKQRRPMSPGPSAGMSGDERKDQSRTSGSVYELRGDEFIIGALSPSGQGWPPGPACGRQGSRYRDPTTHEEYRT
jgi:hypothetical protein